MKSLHVHYLNKYPGGRVMSGDNSLDVFDANGNHAVAMRKNGAGQWADESEALGCTGRHDLAPIPRDCRVFKLARDGKIIRDDQHKVREEIRFAAAEHEIGGEGCVPSIEQIALYKNPAVDLRTLDTKYECAKDLAEFEASPKSAE